MHTPEIMLYHTLFQSAAYADQTSQLIPGLQCNIRQTESHEKVGLSPITGFLHSLSLSPKKVKTVNNLKFLFFMVYKKIAVCN